MSNERKTCVNCGTLQGDVGSYVITDIDEPDTAWHGKTITLNEHLSALSHYHRILDSASNQIKILENKIANQRKELKRLRRKYE